MFLRRQTRMRVTAILLVALTTACAASDSSPQPAAVESAVEGDGGSAPTIDTDGTDLLPGTDEGAPPTTGDEPVTVVIPASIGTPEDGLISILEIIFSSEWADRDPEYAAPTEMSKACGDALSELDFGTNEGFDESDARVIDPSELPDACAFEFLDDFGNVETEMPILVSGDDGSLSFTITQNELDRALEGTRNYISGEARFYQTIKEVSANLDVSDIRIAVDMPTHTASNETSAPYGTYLYAALYRALSGKSNADYTITITVVDHATGDIVETYREKALLSLAPVSGD